MDQTISASVASDVQIKVGNLTATKIADDLSWGVGAIQPQPDYSTAQDQAALITAVLQSILPVHNEELPYSLCTDGRIPVRLANGETIPVREQMVGADMVSAFYVAETLGANFYQNAEAPIAERVADVAAFLKENGLLPSSHIACGAAGGFEAIARNVLQFAANGQYAARQKALLPGNVYDQKLHQTMLEELAARLQTGRYQGLSADTFLRAAQTVSGDRAIAELKNDGRGVQGHVEEAIIRIHLEGYAIDEAQVAERTDGREVFGVNDNRMERLARLFARGDDTDYRKAYLALEDFADAGHGTLAKYLPTWVVTQA